MTRPAAPRGGEGMRQGGLGGARRGGPPTPGGGSSPPPHAVRVDGDLSRARVYYSALTAEAEGRLDGVSEALEEHRRKVQTLVNKQIRARKVPQVEFLPDDVLTHALHIEDVIREMHANGSVASSESAESE